MRFFTCLSTLAAAVATTLFNPAAHAEVAQRYTTQLSVSSADQCGIAVTAEDGTVMAAKYVYTADDQAAGTYGSTSLTTTTPLPVLVSASPSTCQLPVFTVSTQQPGIQVANNVAALQSVQGGVWPIKWMYSAFDSYEDADGTDPSTTATSVATPAFSSVPATSRAGDVPCGPPAGGWTVIGRTANSGNKYGSYSGGFIPAESTAGSGGHIQRAGNSCATPYNAAMGLDMQGMLAAANDAGPTTSPRVYTVTSPATARSVRIELAQLIATFPYGQTTKAPDPLTVYDGETLTGTGTMTITPL